MLCIKDCSTCKFEGYASDAAPCYTCYLKNENMALFNWTVKDNPLAKKEEPTKESKPDMVNHPAHYTYGEYECIKVLDEVTKDLVGCEATYTWQIMKYMWRWKYKNGLEDLHKARNYLERLINKVESGTKAEAAETKKSIIDKVDDWYKPNY